MRKAIPQTGGKNNSVKVIMKLIPYHNSYVEVFGGGASLLFKKELSYFEVYNDKEDNLYNYMRVIRDKPGEFMRYLRRTPKGRKGYNLKGKSLMERVVLFYIRKKSSYGNTGTYFCQNKMDSEFEPKFKEVLSWSMRLRNVWIENLDYKELIRKYDKDDTLFYLDPPYETARKDDYMENWVKENHIELAGILKNLKGKFILSYNDSPFIRKLYKWCKIYEIDVSIRMKWRSKIKSKELIIINYEYK